MRSLCSAWRQTSNLNSLSSHAIRFRPGDGDADYNIAPTTFQPIIRQSRHSGDRELVLARWGLVPFFTKNLSDIKGFSTINARAETIATTPTWREPFKKRRCLVPASAFYEWPKEGKPPKQPYIFELLENKPMAFAGIWDSWKDKDGPMATVLCNRNDRS